MITLPRDAAFETFVALSARLGADPLLVQAAGGNTSVKRDGVLWIKASGKLLREAANENIFVPVDLAGVREGIERDEADPTTGRVLGDTPLRPSIETTLHALLPQRVVLHLHSVNALASEVREDGQAQVARRLEGLPWAWVDYRRPGLPLTRAVRSAAGAATSVLALANHGIVVGADARPAPRPLLHPKAGAFDFESGYPRRLPMAGQLAPRSLLIASWSMAPPWNSSFGPSRLDWMSRFGTMTSAEFCTAGVGLHSSFRVFKPALLIGAGDWQRSSIQVSSTNFVS